MVVPACGSKTINVRLTVSPDSKSKSGDSAHSVKKSSKRQRLKSRRLFKCDDDEEGSGSGCFDANQETTARTAPDELPQQQQTSMLANQSTPVVASEKPNGTVVTGKHQVEPTARVSSKDTVDGRLAPCCINDAIKSQRQPKPNQTIENIYEKAPVAPNETNETNATPLQSKSKCNENKASVTLNNNNSCCQDCRVTSQPYQVDGIPMVSKPCARKLGRKSRSRKQKSLHDSHPAARIRSLSVGNENSYRNCNGDASSGASGKDRTDECLNNLRRNDLIDIIRESMEKSRLCFQSNG